jgi:cold shock CspA family protein
LLNRVYGSVKTVNSNRRFAFITADHAIDCFVRLKDFEKAGLAEPKIGARYSFMIEPTGRGPRAVDLEAE